MNSDTGVLYTNNQYKKLSAIDQAMCVNVDRDTLTEEQINNMRVSLNDRKTPAARKRIKTYNNLRNKPCVCGSGKKFKKCCWGKMKTAQGRFSTI